MPLRRRCNGIHRHFRSMKAITPNPICHMPWPSWPAMLHALVLPLLRPGDRLSAVLQYFRAAAGSFFGLLGRSRKFSMQMLQGEQPTIFGDGTTSRDFTFIDNAISANLLAARLRRGVLAGAFFNCATDGESR